MPLRPEPVAEISGDRVRFLVGSVERNIAVVRLPFVRRVTRWISWGQVFDDVEMVESFADDFVAQVGGAVDVGHDRPAEQSKQPRSRPDAV